MSPSDSAARGITALLWYDDGVEAGLGHRRRCDVVATALRSLGAEAECLPLSGHATTAPTPAGRRRADITVVDSYRNRADQLRIDSTVVAAIEDLDRDLDVDLLIAPGPGATATGKAARRILVGARYALVDPSLKSLPRRPIGTVAKRLLVATGGGSTNLVGRDLAVALSERLPKLDICVAVSPLSEEAAEYEAPTGVAIHVLRTSEGLAGHLAEADLVLTAGGVTLLEALALGRPSIVLVLAENQRPQALACAAAGAACLGPADVDAIDTLSETVSSLASDPQARVALSIAGSRLIDAEGAYRTAKELLHALR